MKRGSGTEVERPQNEQTGTTKKDAAFQVIVLGETGGPLEDAVTGLLVRSTYTSWSKGSIIAVDAGAHLGSIVRILEDELPRSSKAQAETGHTTILKKGPFAGLKLPHLSAKANGLYIFRELLHSFLITHPHLDHIAGLGINTPALEYGREAKAIVALPSIIEAFKTHVFNDLIWPNLSDEGDGVGFVTYRRLIEGGNPRLGSGEGRGYVSACSGLLTKCWTVSHGRCRRKGSASHGNAGSMGFHGESFTFPSRRASRVSEDNTLFATPQHDAAGQSRVASAPALTGLPPDRDAGFVAVDSSAFFIRNETDGSEIIIFGDIEPDSVSLHPRNHIVWEDAASKIASGILKAIFIECSYDDSVRDQDLYGHLCPRHLIAELWLLGSKVNLLKTGVNNNSTQQEESLSSPITATTSSTSPRRKRKRLTGKNTSTSPNGSIHDLVGPSSPQSEYVGRSKSRTRQTSAANNLPVASEGITTSPLLPAQYSSEPLIFGEDTRYPGIPELPSQMRPPPPIQASPQLSTSTSAMTISQNQVPLQKLTGQPLAGLEVYIIHVKETLTDGPEPKDIILQQLREQGEQGLALLHTAQFNKGSAHSAPERKKFNLHGFLPPNVQTLDEQVQRAYDQYCSRKDDLAKNTFMTSMYEQNEVLYFRLIQDHLKEMFPVIYTPTEGDAIQNFSRVFRRPHGCFLNIEDADRVETDLAKFGKPEDVDYIVVSDGEEILGIGDQGVGGILISIAKLVLTTVCAGIHPGRTLPVVLDTGTDNQDLLNDELYLGLRHPRVRGEKYDDFVDKFVNAARKLYPNAYIHFEDFGLPNARKILDRYRQQIPCFNDDIQGTGCVTLAGIMAGLHISKLKLEDVRMVIFGSGSAGTGIAEQVRDAMAAESSKSKEDAAKQIWCVDKPGLLLKSMDQSLTHAQKPFAREDSEWEGKEHKSLHDVIKEVKPHVLIGTSTKPKAFTKEIIQEMAKHVERPIVFPLSNPTRLHEADPKDINDWTNGKALIATGSPFPPVKFDGKEYEIAECNNSTCFPGIGLGAVLCRAKLLTDRMLVSAVKALAALSPALQDPDKALLPDVVDVRDVSVKIASAVIKCAKEDSLTRVDDIPDSDEGLEEWVREQMWKPEYRELVKHGETQ